jgi:hypothetical protein
MLPSTDIIQVIKERQIRKMEQVILNKVLVRNSEGKVIVGKTG